MHHNLPCLVQGVYFGRICLALSGPCLFGLKKGVRESLNEVLEIELSTPGLGASDNRYLVRLLELLQREIRVWIFNGEMVESHKGAKSQLATVETVTHFPGTNIGN